MSHQPRKPAVDKEPEISHLLRRPAASVRTEPEIRHHPDKEKEHLGKIDHQREGKLQGHYQRTLPECLSAGTINTFPRAFKQILDGQKATSPVNESVQDCLDALNR